MTYLLTFQAREAGGLFLSSTQLFKVCNDAMGNVTISSGGAVIVFGGWWRVCNLDLTRSYTCVTDDGSCLLEVKINLSTNGRLFSNAGAVDLL